MISVFVKMCYHGVFYFFSFFNTFFSVYFILKVLEFGICNKF